MDTFRGLAAADPDRWRPDLAASLNNLSNRLGDTGDAEGALAAFREALDAFRHLAAAAPDRWRPDLAQSVNNLSIRLSDTGDAAGALAAIEEAIALIEPFAARWPTSRSGQWLAMMRRDRDRLSGAGS
ncbi:MAG: tetratricopeptide repeat protein [Azospirillum sp.]|nr:tetratricopeptide repeat protein [Azospirillum sp.]